MSVVINSVPHKACIVFNLKKLFKASLAREEWSLVTFYTPNYPI